MPKYLSQEEEPSILRSLLVQNTPVLRPARNPSVFSGDHGEDPDKWIKEYERVARFNQWDSMMSLANVFFFLNGTARQWYENAENTLLSWDLFKTELKATFGDEKHLKNIAEDKLKSRAQRAGETSQSYIQDVLGLCHQVNPNMAEEDQVGHLMKGIAEDVYQALLMKQITTKKDFITWCQHIEMMKQKRISPQHFARLPNVTAVAAISEHQDLASLVRQIVREEINKILPQALPIPQSQPLESIIREEVVRSLAPISQAPSAAHEEMPFPSYAAAVRHVPTSPHRPAVSYDRPSSADIPPRKTDLWRSNDNRPLCFYCGRPGHVVRHCRERRREYRDNGGRRTPEENSRTYPTEFPRPPARSSSPYPRNQSPSRRTRSPFRQSSRSPMRREEN